MLESEAADQIASRIRGRQACGDRPCWRALPRSMKSRGSCENARWLFTILALTATTAGKATGTASVPAARSTPTPGGENGSIFWPWIGRDYATGGVCLVGLNPPRLEVVVSDARRVRHLLKHARRTREGKTHDRHQQVPAQAAQPQQLPRAAHRRGLRASRRRSPPASAIGASAGSTSAARFRGAPTTTRAAASGTAGARSACRPHARAAGGLRTCSPTRASPCRAPPRGAEASRSGGVHPPRAIDLGEAAAHPEQVVES